MKHDPNHSPDERTKPPQPRKTAGRDRFPFGAVYILEQERSKPEIVRDFNNMRDMGFNLVTLWPVANSWLAGSSDEFVFDDTRWVLDLCAECGMKAILQLIGQNPSQEYMPDCLFTSEMLTSEMKSCFWANPNHPDVDRCIREYIRRAITALKDHSAVYAWDVFNEVQLYTEDRWTIRLFHEWLRAKYGSIGELNRRWYRRYSSFDQVNPVDRNAQYSLWSSVLPAVDFE
ncbi:MAG: beta-galactosidase, partial [Verrucomicrobia bacterium]|nr:beta-galactosidase [Verrucomicrobiota bacterium]